MPMDPFNRISIVFIMLLLQCCAAQGFFSYPNFYIISMGGLGELDDFQKCMYRVITVIPVLRPLVECRIF